MIKLLKRLHWLHDWGGWTIHARDCNKPKRHVIIRRDCKHCYDFQFESVNIGDFEVKEYMGESVEPMRPNYPNPND